MIFDSPQMAALCEQYRLRPDYLAPVAVRLKRSERLIGEREYLEELIRLAPDAKRKDWISRLASEDDDNHLGAWFEIMLFGWLRQVGTTEVEPLIAGNAPDFRVLANKPPICIEARAVLKPPQERNRVRRIAEVFSLLRTIEKPYMLTMLTCQFGGDLDGISFYETVAEWLDGGAREVLIYSDSRGNRIGFRADHAQGLRRLDIMSPATAKSINPDILKGPLKEKALQHRQLRRAGHAYVIAVWLEDWLYSAHEVVQAWLGRVQVDIEIDTGKILGQRVDRSGLHFRGNAPVHTTVSGTLVFRANYNDSALRNELQAWYLQNPFASMPIAPSAFPVQAAWVVTGQGAEGLVMSWRPKMPD